MYRKLASIPVSCFTLTPSRPSERSCPQCRGNGEGRGTREALRETRSPTMSEIDVPTETAVGWLSPEQLELVRAHVPLVYVDAVPVRVDALGNGSPQSACCSASPPTVRSAGWSSAGG